MKNDKGALKEYAIDDLMHQGENESLWVKNG